MMPDFNIGEVLALWDKLSTVPNPDFIVVSPSFVRAWRK
jgi:hypothetical protein